MGDKFQTTSLVKVYSRFTAKNSCILRRVATKVKRIAKFETFNFEIFLVLFFGGGGNMVLNGELYNVQYPENGWP